MSFRDHKIDYKYVRYTVDEIERGNKKILRLPEEAEKGRIEGGRGAIEASVILGTTEKTDRAELGQYEVK